MGPENDCQTHHVISQHYDNFRVCLWGTPSNLKPGNEEFKFFRAPPPLKDVKYTKANQYS